MYKIVRSYLNHPSKTIKRGLTLKEAQAHCGDPETSSTTCTKPELIAHTERMGPWFDGYDEE
jgi:hypothetical protein